MNVRRLPRRLAAAALLGLVAAAPASAPLDGAVVWRFAGPGSGIGASGFVTADIDDDGDVDVVSGGGAGFGANYYWHVHEYRAATSSYAMTWASPPSPSPISALAGYDPDGDGLYHVFLGDEAGVVRVHDGATKAELAVLSVGGGAIRRILHADADNDGVAEIMCSSDGATALFHPTTYALEQTIPYGASDVEVGNVDGDAFREIVLADGRVLQLVGVSLTVQWTYAGGAFGALVELSDIDADGMEEIVGAAAWYNITAFDADVQSPKWQMTADLDIDALLLVDVTGDGVKEILYGDGQWGSVYCHDAGTRALLWSIANPEHGVTTIAVHDTDADGALEILWGSGHSSSGQDLLLVYGVASRAEEWRSDHVDGPYDAVDVGDVDNDGSPEIVLCSFESESGYDDGVIVILDAATKAVEWRSPHGLFGGQAWTGVHDVRIGNIDGDPQKEILVATDRLYDGAIYVIDGLTHALQNSWFYDDGAPMYSLAIADVDNDGAIEIVAGGGREHTGAPGVYVYVISASTGAVEWNSVNIGDMWSDIHITKVGDVDGNGQPDIVTIKDSCYIINGVTHVQWQSAFAGCTALDLADVTGDGRLDILLGKSDGSIVAIDGLTKGSLGGIAPESTAIDGVRAVDVDGNGTVEVVASSDGRVGVYSLAGVPLLPETILVGGGAGRYGSLVVADTVPGGNLEILAGNAYSVAEIALDEAVPPPPPPPPTGGGGGGGGGGGSCGLLGLDALLLLAWVRRISGRRAAA